MLKIARVVINIQGQDKNLYQIQERKSGDLTIMLKHGGKLTKETAEELGVHKETTIKNQRYSIHLSPQSLEENTIKHTLELENEKNVETYHLTKALKKHNPYMAVPVVSQLHLNLSLKKYNNRAKRKETKYSFGRFFPEEHTLFTGLFITKKEFRIEKDFKHCNYLYIEFSNFNILILKTILFFPSSPDGYFAHFLNPPHNSKTEKQINSFKEGFHINILEELFMKTCNLNLNEILKTYKFKTAPTGIRNIFKERFFIKNTLQIPQNIKNPNAVSHQRRHLRRGSLVNHVFSWHGKYRHFYPALPAWPQKSFRRH